MKIGESVCRTVFGALFFGAAVAVYLLAPSSYILVAAVLAINGILCCVSGIINLVKISAARKEMLMEEARAIAERQAMLAKFAPEIERCRELYNSEVAKYEGRVDMHGYVMKNDVWYEYHKVLCDGDDLLFVKDCNIDKVLRDGVLGMSRFEWSRYSFEDEVIFRCRVSDIVFFRHADDGNYRIQTGYGIPSAVSGKVILRVNNEQIVFTKEAYNIFMSLVPQKEYDYIVVTQNIMM